MFSSNKGSRSSGGYTANVPSKTDVPSIISSDMNILGNLISEGSVEVAGRVEGNVTCKAVTVHRSGLIKGDIIADTVQVNGEVRGLIKARNVRLSENGRVIGVIMYESLTIEGGAFVDGQCKNTDKLNRKHDALEALEAHNMDDEADVRVIEEEDVDA
jgi:cytoskeletal protein CcmA (bactofilin family)